MRLMACRRLRALYLVHQFIHCQTPTQFGCESSGTSPGPPLTEEDLKEMGKKLWPGLYDIWADAEQQLAEGGAVQHGDDEEAEHAEDAVDGEDYDTE